MEPQIGIRRRVGPAMPNGGDAFAPMPHDANYNTPLNPVQQSGFNAWAKQLAASGHDVRKDTGDYDMQGAFLGGAGQGANGHFPDTWKKPNHPTFSTESQYALGEGRQPGQWDTDPQGKDRFTAGATNLQNPGGAQSLLDYFRRVEPGVTLRMPFGSLPGPKGPGFGGAPGGIASSFPMLGD